MIWLRSYFRGSVTIALVGAATACSSSAALSTNAQHLPVGNAPNAVIDRGVVEKWEVAAPPPTIDCRNVTADARTRLYPVEAVGRYVNVGHLACSGYYTIIIFSAPSCAPCREILAQAPNWLNRYPNLVFVEVNVGDADGPQWEILRDLNFVGQGVPLGVLLGPLGHLMYRMSGADEIQMRLAKMDDRWHKGVIWGAADAAFSAPASDAAISKQAPSEPTIRDQQESGHELAPAPTP
jgi:thiol-disulfide isomerase/thioredoxin